MSDNIVKDDLRIIKTYKALIKSMVTLLGRQNFGKITVNDLCEEALVSRATFYAHFKDKYDFLNYWLIDLGKNFTNSICKFTSEQMELKANQFVSENSKIILNLIDGADSEVLDLIYDFISYIISTSNEKNSETNFNHTVLNKFCAAGVVNLLLWQVKSKSPLEIQPLNTYFFEMLKCIMEWDAQQK